MFFYFQLSEDDLQLEQFQEWVDIMLAKTASAQGIDIETPDVFETWLVQQRLNDPDFVLTQLNQQLEAMVGDEWLFDRTAITGKSLHRYLEKRLWGLFGVRWRAEQIRKCYQKDKQGKSGKRID